MPFRRRMALFLAGAIVVAGCELVVDTSGLSSGGPAKPDSADDTSTTSVVDAPVQTEASSSGDGAIADAGPSPRTCTSNAGPPMVLVPEGGTTAPFCIDSVEVTGDEYEAFLAIATLSLFPPDCAFKTSYSHSTDDGGPARVDWCDAYAYCAAAGKRLCGKAGGGPNGFGDFANQALDQWYIACTGGGAGLYPYGGAAFQPSYCNGAAFDAGAPLPPKSAARCQGGFPGIYDMSGNVWEWEDSCIKEAGADAAGTVGDLCRVRGGCFVDEGDELRCDFDSTEHFYPVRGSTSPYVGFRCCSDL